MVRFFPYILVVIAASILISGCGDEHDSAKPVPPDAEVVPPIPVPPEDLKALVDGDNQFAIELYKAVAAKQTGNLLISPYSISSALAMTYAGARGETAAQMAKTLHFTLPPERLHPAFGGTTQWLTSDGKKSQYDLSIANALWAQQGMAFVPEFLDITAKSYRAGLREVDYASDPNKARGTINRWVEAQTRDKIKDLLQRDDVTSNTRLVLSNAVYFRGDWKHPFNPQDTHEAEFETAMKSHVKVQMMAQSMVAARQVRTETWDALELPYAGGRLAMVVMLPRKRCGLQEAEARLNNVELQQLLAKLSEEKAEVLLPKFQFASRSKLSPVLHDLGMPIAFSGEADFSGITPGGGLSIKDVIHGGSVEVDEVGTVAAAATAVVMNISDTVPFRVDHPFLFLIRDTQVGNLLFLGRCANPTIGQK